MQQVAVWHDSLSLFRHALAVTSDNQVAENDYADALLSAGANQEAVVHARRSIGVQADFPDAWNNLGLGLMRVGDGSGARICFRRILHEYHHYWRAWYNLALVETRFGDRKLAITYFQNAGSLVPANGPVFRDWAVLMVQLNDPRAEMVLAQAERLMPGDGLVRLTAGNWQFGKQHWEAAATAYAEAAALLPQRDDAWSNLGAAEIQLGRLVAAREHLERARVLNPRNAYTWNSLAVCASQQGQRQAAIGYLQQALALDPSLTTARANLERLQREAAAAGNGTAGTKATEQP